MANLESNIPKASVIQHVIWHSNPSGSRRGHRAAFGWIAYGAEQIAADGQEEWTAIASKSGILTPCASITAAELEGTSNLTWFLESYYQGYGAARTEISKYRFIIMDHKVIQYLSLAEMV